MGKTGTREFRYAISNPLVKPDASYPTVFFETRISRMDECHEFFLIYAGKSVGEGQKLGLQKRRYPEVGVVAP
jgi:hypothetical protein